MSDTRDTLPPLPAVPFARVGHVAGRAAPMVGAKPDDPLFTADQMRAYAAEALRAAPPGVPQDVQQDADRWRYIADRWTHADFRWNRYAGNTPKSVTLTVKAGPSTGSRGGQVARFIDEAIAAEAASPHPAQTAQEGR